MNYKCILFKFNEYGGKHTSQTALFFNDASLDDVFKLLLPYSRNGWQYANVFAFVGTRWRYCGIFWIEEGSENG